MSSFHAFTASYLVNDCRPQLEQIPIRNQPIYKRLQSETWFEKYHDLPIPEDKILVTYIWVDGSEENLRSKTRTLDYIPKAPVDKFLYCLGLRNAEVMEEAFKDIKYSHANQYLPPYFCPRNLENIYKVKCALRNTRNTQFFEENLKDLPIWTFNGYACGMNEITNADTLIFPRSIYRDPFKCGHHILAMCDTYNSDMEPSATNHRAVCADSHSKCIETEPWFGIGQEYYILDSSDYRPFGWPKCGYPLQRNHYYCSTGADKSFARDLVDAHSRCCLYAGVPIAGINSEKSPAQWGFQIGPSVGVNAGDDLWIARYILNRLAEEYGVIVSYDPKPVPNWSGSGAHFNFSTNKSRAENGIFEIEKFVKRMSSCHMQHIQVYDPRKGEDNKRRLIGKFGTARFDEFSAGVADRFCSIRIPRAAIKSKTGYMEDRRPAANCDPYRVIDQVLRTCVLLNSE